MMFKDELLKRIDQRNIIDNPEILIQFSKDISFNPPSMPFLAVRPENREDIRAVVKLAEKHNTPLVPVSSGPPRFHGDTIPEQRGVIIDFSKMKRIFEIDPVSRYARVEPGVTYGELIPELNKKGLRLNVPLIPRASKSVLTSCLEREPRLIPKYQYDYVDPLLTLEVIYGTGEDFRTGSASGPGTLETLKADKVNPWGPGSIDYFRFLTGAQGTMGLVTWATTKTEVLPALQKLYFIPIEDVDRLTAPMNILLKKRVVDECLALNHVNLATILAETWPQDFEALKTNLPPWTVLACVAGYERRPEERMSIQEKSLIDICTALGLETHTTLPGDGIHGDRVLELLSNPWNKEPYWKLRRKGSCYDIFFLTTLSRVSKFIELMKRTVSKYRYPFYDIGGYIQPMVQGRGCHCEFSLPCDPSDTEEAAEVKKLFMEASETLMNNGAFFSRPYGPWADMVYSRYEGPVTALKKLKNIFDPNNILNPGKLCF
jgi:FAD binding domain/FAD linked oxidases, C-terminal domain